MYEKFYGLHTKPFSILPDPDFIFWSRSHALAFGMMEYGVLNGAGFTVVTGEIGCGKTTLIRELLRKVSGAVTIGVLSNTGPQGGDLMRWILMSLGQPYEAPSGVTLYKQFQDFLFAEHARGRHVLLIIDEAQNLGAVMLEELRLLSNLNADGDQLLQLILVGQPELKQLLEAPELKQFSQRVSSDFHLSRLNQRDFVNYIEHRLSVAGATRALFTQEALDLVYKASRGVPRLVNIICDTAMIYGYANDSQTISHDIIQMVLRDKKKYGALSLDTDLEAENTIVPRLVQS
jgi:type II secretory pathway predicted ATPase ExeA